MERDSSEIKNHNWDRNFESKLKFICYACGKAGHIKINCPFNKEKSENPMNNLKVEKIFSESF